MIRVKHNLQSKRDELDKVSVDLVVSVQEGLEKTRLECIDKINEICPDHGDFFDVSVDGGMMNIKISPTQDVLSDSDKMRYYEYLMSKNKQELADFIKNRLNLNVRHSFRYSGIGGGNVY